MDNIRFNYLYRDGSNYKSWGEIVFPNPDQLSADEIDKRLTKAFLPDKLFIASQVLVPEKFLFLSGNFTEFDHCYHEFDCIEICKEKPSDKLGRSILEFIKQVEQVANKGWKAFDILYHALIGNH